MKGETAVENCQIDTSSSSGLRIILPKCLAFESLGPNWQLVHEAIKKDKSGNIELAGEYLEFCDSAGISFLTQIDMHAQKLGKTVSFSHISESISNRIREFREFSGKDWKRRDEDPAGTIKSTGITLVHLWKDIKSQVEFLGELVVQTLVMLRHPGKIPWREIITISERVGARALGIVSLISFLIGLIMAFQSAIPMKQFGAELFVADLVGISLVRELGPLMTAILLAGRTGAAFAAELGTMKVNEEIDALTTMGLKPVRFLVVSRVLATVIMTPILTAYANFMGLVGGGIVFCSFGFPLITYLHELDLAVKVMDFTGGMIKSFVFGFIVAAIGCLRGLQTKSGASAVGQSTTSAVVSGIILIVVADGIFSVLYYYLEI